MPAQDVMEYHLTAAAAVTPQQRARAVRAVASSASDAAECARLLDMLGLNAEDARPAVPEPRPAELSAVHPA